MTLLEAWQAEQIETREYEERRAIAATQREECAEYVARQYVGDEAKALKMRDIVLSSPLVRP